MFGKLLIANRGEVAVRVIRACQDAGIRTVAVFSEADRDALHVRLADEAHPIGPAPATESYLAIDRLVAVARRTGAEAVHPGYGFLAENAAFAEACRAAGLVFVGPPSAAIARMGDKTAARRAAVEAGVPIVPGTPEPVGSDAEARRAAKDLGFPVMIKAARGGGGKGMRVVSTPGELESALRLARSEAAAAFGDGAVYVEKAIVEPRHVEIQVLADAHGQILHLGERECSIQRRHQKLVEESPSSAVDGALRAEMGGAACRLLASAGYQSAGTVEFLLDSGGRFYFLEVNTRLQVEHPVTELVTGVDLVREQLRLAAGEKLGYSQADVAPRGWAIECRISAEDPAAGFIPSPGRIATWRPPAGPWVRVDSGVYEGGEVSLHYDPLMAKLIVWGRDRGDAVGRMRRALGEFRVTGVRTTIPFHRAVMRHPDFLGGRLSTAFVERAFAGGLGPPSPERARAAAVAAALRARALVPSAPPAGTSGPSRWAMAGRPVPRERPAVTSPGTGRRPSRLSVQVEDATFTIEIEELGSGALEVRVDGCLVDVDARLPASGAGSLLLDGVSYVVDFGEAGEDMLLAVDGETFRVRLDDPVAGRRRDPIGATTGGGTGQRLVAPMSGKVVKVLVEVGQPVERGAGLVVLEAMKMENEFRATGSGRVSEIHVEPGQVVDVGALLVVIA